MGKDYDREITPQNTPRMPQRRRLFLFFAGLLLLTALLIAMLSQECRAVGLACAAWIVLQSSTQLWDRRKEHWTWGYIILMCIVFFVGGVSLILLSGLYWCFLLWGIALVAVILFVIYDRRKRRRKNKRR